MSHVPRCNCVLVIILIYAILFLYRNHPVCLSVYIPRKLLLLLNCLMDFDETSYEGCTPYGDMCEEFS